MKILNTVFIFFLVVILSSSSNEKPQSDFCGIKNTAFVAGEQITYHVYYSNKQATK